MRNIIYTDEYLELIIMASKRNLTKKAAKELGLYGVYHHIIPRCVAPEFAKEKSNIVFLTHEEHYNAHKILALANPNDPIAYAWKMMIAKKETSEFFTDKDYAEAMKIVSDLRKGKPRPAYIIQKLRESNIGRSHSEEWRKNQSKRMTGLNNPRYGKGKVEGAGTPPISIYCIEYPEIIFKSFEQADLLSKNLGWTAVRREELSRYFKGIRKSVGKDANGNKLHWKKVEE